MITLAGLRDDAQRHFCGAISAASIWLDVPGVHTHRTVYLHWLEASHAAHAYHQALIDADLIAADANPFRTFRGLGINHDAWDSLGGELLMAGTHRGCQPSTIRSCLERLSRGPQ